MIFICVTKNLPSNRHFWTATMTSDNNRLLNSINRQILVVYSVSGCFLKLKEKPFGLCTWKGQLKPRVLVELPLLVFDVISLKDAAYHPRRGEEGAVYIH